MHGQASGLLGELASLLVDTDAFGNFIRDQGVQKGCSKTGLMEETMKQAPQSHPTIDSFDSFDLFDSFDSCHFVCDLTVPVTSGSFCDLWDGLLVSPLQCCPAADTSY